MNTQTDNPIFASPEYAKFAEEHHHIDADLLKRIVAEFAYDLRLTEKNLDKHFCGVWGHWDDYVDSEAPYFLLRRHGKEMWCVWQDIKRYIDWGQLDADLAEERLVVSHPVDDLVAVFHFS